MKESFFEIAKRSADSQEFPTPEWLQSVGFSMSETNRARRARIVIDNYDDNCGNARVELKLSWFKMAEREWVADVESYSENGTMENAVGLVGSWPTTKAEVFLLCRALNVQSWRGAE